jgi:aminopeptidase
MYTPSQKVLQNYANVLINFALNSGKGIKKGETVYLAVQQPGLPLGKEVYKAVIKAGGNVILNIMDDDFKLLQMRNATDAQIAFFPEKYYRGLADSIDQWVRILADDDPMFLKDTPPSKIILSNKAAKPFRRMLDQKEDAGKFTWTLCLYPTEGTAREAGLSLKEYWGQVEKACFLTEPNPIRKWQQVYTHMQRILTNLNALPVDKFHITAKDTDLWITLGEKRRWMGGRGRNIPSFEIFTSPDWRGTEGTIFFDLPLYRYGNIVKDVTLQFHNGRIVKASAKKNDKFLQEMIKQKNADKIGEFSLTDRRFSKITKIMATTLFDENFGGTYGNTHLAVGKSYHDTYTGDQKKMTDKAYEKLGFNDSVEHTDIIASTDRKVVATLKDGSTKVIYEGGEFRV